MAGYRQVTDAHLIALAARRGGTRVTFNSGLVELAGRGGREAVEVIRAGVSLGE